MKKVNYVGVVFYVITSFISLITIFMEYGSVSRNLDGMRDFNSGHAMIFVIICLAIIAVCIYNALNLVKNNSNILMFILGVLIVCSPLAMHMYAVSLAGNVDTDMQYLMLRLFQGFDNTYLFITIGSGLGLITLILQKIKR